MRQELIIYMQRLSIWKSMRIFFSRLQQLSLSGLVLSTVTFGMLIEASKGSDAR